MFPYTQSIFCLLSSQTFRFPLYSARSSTAFCGPPPSNPSSSTPMSSSKLPITRSVTSCAATAAFSRFPSSTVAAPARRPATMSSIESPTLGQHQHFPPMRPLKSRASRVRSGNQEFAHHYERQQRRVRSIGQRAPSRRLLLRRRSRRNAPLGRDVQYPRRIGFGRPKGPRHERRERVCGEEGRQEVCHRRAAPTL